MTDYPIKVEWYNENDIVVKFISREIQPLRGTPQSQRDISDEELDIISQAIWQRSKSYIVIENSRERELVLSQLQRFVNGIAHPSYGGEWASKQKAKAVYRAIEEIQGA